MGMVAFFPVFNEPSFIKCILMIVHQHHYAIVHEHSYWVVHQQQKNPLHQQNRWWSGFFCRWWTCFLWPSLNKIVGQEPLFLVREQLYGIVPELAFISRWWIYPNSLADILPPPHLPSPQPPGPFLSLEAHIPASRPISQPRGPNPNIEPKTRASKPKTHPQGPDSNL